MVWTRLRQKINVKYFMVGYLTLLLLFSSAFLKDYKLFLQAIYLVALYSIYDLAWTYWRDKIWYLPVSSWISGLVLSLVVRPNLPIAFIILLPLVAVTSKQLFHLGKNRHIFNPASFALAVGALATPLVAWWAPGSAEMPRAFLNLASPDSDSGTILFGIIALGGIFILWRQKRWHITVPFFISYAFFLGILLLANGVALMNIPRALTAQLVNGVTIFFATVMLVEPLTSTFDNFKHEIIYGVIVGLAVVIITYLTAKFHFPNQDPLVYGLLIGNLLGGLLFL